MKKFLLLTIILLTARPALGAERVNARVADSFKFTETIPVLLAIEAPDLDRDALNVEFVAILSKVEAVGEGGRRLPAFEFGDSAKVLFEAGIVHPGEMEPKDIMKATGSSAVLLITASAKRRRQLDDKRIDANLELQLVSESGLLLFGEATLLVHGLRKLEKVLIKALKSILLELADQYRSPARGELSVPK